MGHRLGPETPHLCADPRGSEGAGGRTNKLAGVHFGDRCRPGARMRAVENYLAELDRSLYGPVRKKSDLLAEARDSLTDAVEAYRGAGCADPELRAVAEFGDVRLIAQDYQAELGVAAGVHAL